MKHVAEFTVKAQISCCDVRLLSWTLKCSLTISSQGDKTFETDVWTIGIGLFSSGDGLCYLIAIVIVIGQPDQSGIGTTSASIQ